MLMIVIEKPMQVIMVREVPLICATAFCATRVENKGESAITTNPQKIKNARNGIAGRWKTRGDMIQQHPDKNRAVKAVFLTPNTCER